MNQIEPYPLRIGHCADGADFRVLFDQGVRAVVQVAWEEPPLQLPREMILCRVPLADGGENPPELIRLAIAMVDQLLRERVSTLVCCSSGLSRAPALAAAALARFTGQPLGECLQEVTRHRHADVHPGLYESIERVLAVLSVRTK